MLRNRTAAVNSKPENMRGNSSQVIVDLSQLVVRPVSRSPIVLWSLVI